MNRRNVTGNIEEFLNVAQEKNGECDFFTGQWGNCINQFSKPAPSGIPLPGDRCSPDGRQAV